ncbi:hypothetical protein [Ligilactobacillus salivarius]|jgi:hypothetical protein|uniref:DUF5067 domain-containing protein n=3 Tax=Ligilactobacillus salivarius TaxID=1624 RepID=A0AAW7N785_9LACO|nr:hypothetical protein [Ligilactobacillus salivarius]AYC11700.1 hypothetical protein LS1_01750 [Ligilactobacillus salivarius]MDE1524892.1 hypothetical protein [Ligilactobacillus salivarius]MDE7521572.1 hypothetical protein [Ligilactobacillus salivarius]MDN4833503.1 hypothetical protein [Ligilactobacillus salivarius]
MILPLRILMFLLMLAIAYFIFRWNKNNSGKKRWYALAIIFALASFGALGDTPESRHQEAVESSKAESSSIKESERKESISIEEDAKSSSLSEKKASSIKAKQQSQNQNNAEAIVTYLSNELNNEYNDTFTVSYDKNQNKIIMVCHDQSVVNTAKQANSSKEALDDWLEFEGAMHQFSNDALDSKWNIRIPFVIEDDNGTKLLEVKGGYTVYNIIDHE